MAATAQDSQYYYFYWRRYGANSFRKYACSKADYDAYKGIYYCKYKTNKTLSAGGYWTEVDEEGCPMVATWIADTKQKQPEMTYCADTFYYAYDRAEKKSWRQKKLREKKKKSKPKATAGKRCTSPNGKHDWVEKHLGSIYRRRTTGSAANSREQETSAHVSGGYAGFTAEVGGSHKDSRANSANSTLDLQRTEQALVWFCKNCMAQREFRL